MPIPIASKLLAKMIIAIKIIINSSSSVFEVFAPLVSIAPLALLVLLYYIHACGEKTGRLAGISIQYKILEITVQVTATHHIQYLRCLDFRVLITVITTLILILGKIQLKENLSSASCTCKPLWSSAFYK